MYAAAVFGNRAIAFLNLLLIAYLLDQENFGLYTLLASNALLLQLVLGSWASASVSKYIPIASAEHRFAPLSTVLLGFLLVSAIEAVAAVVYIAFPVSTVAPIYIALVGSWSLALMVYEVTLSTQNALGASKDYAVVALSRNILALILSLLAAFSGWGVIGAAAGQIAGTLLPCLVLPSSRAMWRQASLRESSLLKLREQIVFGVGGLIASGLYVLFSAIMRNIVAISQGKVVIGQISLACDLFFVPLALIVNVLFLAKMPRLYVLSASKNRRDDRTIEIQTIARGLLALVVPFMTAGVLIADRLILAVLPGHVGVGLAPFAPAAAVFGGAFALLYTISMLLLIFDHRRWLIITAIGTVASNAVLQALLPESTTPSSVLWAANAVVLIGGLLSTWRFLAAEHALPRVSFLIRVVLATGLMSAVLLMTRWTPLLVTPLVVPAGLLAYGGALWWFGAFDRRDVGYFREGWSRAD